MKIDILRIKIEEIILSNENFEFKLQQICDLLEREVSYYDWVGFYFKNGDKDELKLAQFTGEETEHTIIPFGKGICGQVAVSNENFVVQDVSKQENYISCGWKVKSRCIGCTIVSIRPNRIFWIIWELSISTKRGRRINMPPIQYWIISLRNCKI